MRHELAAATLLAGFLVPAVHSTAGDLGAPGQRPTSPGVGYACVSNPRAPQTKVLQGAPPAGFSCPKGQQLFVVTQRLQDAVAAAPVTEVEEAAPTAAPGAPIPPKARKRIIKRKQCTSDGTGGQYCCYGGTSDCRLE